jgi:protein-arginine kinase
VFELSNISNSSSKVSLNFGKKMYCLTVLDDCVRINLEFVYLENVGYMAPVVLKLGIKLR